MSDTPHYTIDFTESEYLALNKFYSYGATRGNHREEGQPGDGALTGHIQTMGSFNARMADRLRIAKHLAHVGGDILPLTYEYEEMLYRMIDGLRAELNALQTEPARRTRELKQEVLSMRKLALLGVAVHDAISQLDLHQVLMFFDDGSVAVNYCTTEVSERISALLQDVG